MGMLLRRHEEARQAEAAALRAQDHKNALILEERRAAVAVVARAAEAQVMTVASVFHSDKVEPPAFEPAKVEPEKFDDVKVDEADVEDEESDDEDEDKDEESEVKVVKRGKKKK